jgi:hypothetical protein
MVRRLRVAALAWIAFIAGAIVPSASCAEERPIVPFTVIDRAIVRWQARPRPVQLSYVVNFTGHIKSRAFRRRFRVDDRVADHATQVTVIASEGPAPPFVQPEKQRLLPTETFGFVSPEVQSAMPTPDPSMSALPVIAAVRATVRYPYDVRFVGIESVDDRSAYHLVLEPRQTPDAYPLRDMWIDASTYDVLQVVALEFEHLGPIAVPYTINARYAQQGPYWLIAHAQAGATIRAGIFSYGSSADASFEDFQYAP